MYYYKLLPMTILFRRFDIATEKPQIKSVLVYILYQSIAIYTVLRYSVSILTFQFSYFILSINSFHPTSSQSPPSSLSRFHPLQYLFSELSFTYLLHMTISKQLYILNIVCSSMRTVYCFSHPLVGNSIKSLTWLNGFNDTKSIYQLYQYNTNIGNNNYNNSQVMSLANTAKYLDMNMNLKLKWKEYPNKKN